MSLMLDLPTLVLLHGSVSSRGIFDRGAANVFVHPFDSTDPAWLDGIASVLAALKSEPRRLDRPPREDGQGSSEHRAADRLRPCCTKAGAAPDFSLGSDTGETVTLSSLRGAPVVLFFYPKDDTPGCTAQACGIRDAWEEFQRAGATVLGVSILDERSKATFKAKYDLPFTLLADPEHEVAEQYGVWVEKKNYGKTYMGLQRSTFVIDADGTISKIFRNVKPAEHADQVLAALSGDRPPLH